MRDVPCFLLYFFPQYFFHPWIDFESTGSQILNKLLERLLVSHPVFTNVLVYIPLLYDLVGDPVLVHQSHKRRGYKENCNKGDEEFQKCILNYGGQVKS